MKRKQYRLVIAFWNTIHKSQYSALEFVVGDLNCATDKGANAASVNRGQVYTLLSRATSRGNITSTDWNFRLCDMYFQYQVMGSTYWPFSHGPNLYRTMFCALFTETNLSNQSYENISNSCQDGMVFINLQIIILLYVLMLRRYRLLDNIM